MDFAPRSIKTSPRVDVLLGVLGFGGRCGAVAVCVLVRLQRPVVLKLTTACRADEQWELLLTIFLFQRAAYIPRLRKIRLYPVAEAHSAHVGAARVALGLRPIAGLHVAEESRRAVLLRCVRLPALGLRQ